MELWLFQGNRVVGEILVSFGGWDGWDGWS